MKPSILTFSSVFLPTIVVATKASVRGLIESGGEEVSPAGSSVEIYKKKKDRELPLFYQWASAFVPESGCEGGRNCAGDFFTYIGQAQDMQGGSDVGMVRESCTRLQDNAPDWQCSGTYTNLYGYDGILSYEGYFRGSEDPDRLDGSFVISGGTGDLIGATGVIHDDFDNTKFQSNRVVTLDKH